MHKTKMSWSYLATCTLLAACLLLAQGCARPNIHFSNDVFYKSDGSFDQEAAKDA